MDQQLLQAGPCGDGANSDRLALVDLPVLGLIHGAHTLNLPPS